MKLIRCSVFKILIPFFCFLTCAGGEPEIKKKVPVKNPTVINKVKGLTTIAPSCLNFFNVSADFEAKTVGSAFEGIIKLEDVIETLKFIEKIQLEDEAYIKNNHKQANGELWEYRLSQYWYLLQNFDFYRVYGNVYDAKIKKISLPYGKVKLTKYAIFEIDVSNKKTWTYNTEIYAIPEWVNPNTGLKQYRLRFSKHDIFRGVYREGGIAAGKAATLAYASRSDFENVMLQGTFVGVFDDGRKQLFGSAGNNEVPFNSRVKVSKQNRYIYFKALERMLGYGKTELDKIKIEEEVTFAGDVHRFGLGKLMLVHYTDVETKQNDARLGILADTGSAFVDNSFHFDYLLGSYKNKKSFYHDANNIPEFCDVYFLIKKSK